MTKHFSTALALLHLVQCPILLEACPQSSFGSRSASEDEIPFSKVVISLLPLALSPAASAIYNASLCEGLSSRNGNKLIFVSTPRLPSRLLVSGGGLSASLPASHLCSSPQAPSNLVSFPDPLAFQVRRRTCLHPTGQHPSKY